MTLCIAKIALESSATFCQGYVSGGMPVLNTREMVIGGIYRITTLVTGSCTQNPGAIGWMLHQLEGKQGER